MAPLRHSIEGHPGRPTLAHDLDLRQRLPKILDASRGDLRPFEVEFAQAGQGTQVYQTGVGHTGSPEDQLAQPGQPAQVGQSGVGDRRPSEIQRPQAEQASEVYQASIGDRCAAEVERRQLDEIAQVYQAGVRDPWALEVKLPEVPRQTGKLRSGRRR